MDTNTTGLGKQIAIWGGIFIVTALIIGGLIYATTRNQAAVSDGVRNAAIDYAKSLNLNVDQFTKDLDSSELANKIDTKIAEGEKIPITYTPTFFLNGTRIDNPKGYDDFKSVITQALNGAPIVPSAGDEVKISDYIN